MVRLGTIILYGLLFMSTYSAIGQMCPNLNAESGNFTNWELFTGSFNEPFQNPGLDAASHRVFTGTIQDANIPDLSVSAIGIYSYILGNDGEGSETDKMHYTIDVNESNYLIVINYLPVFTQELEPEIKASKFSVQIMNGSEPVSECLIDTFFADLSNPKYIQYENNDETYLYTSEWQTMSLSLETYIGQTIEILFASDECFFSNHYTYTYLDVQCIEPLLYVSGCNNQFVLEAPQGFENYLWSNGDVGQQISVSSLIELVGLSVDVSNSPTCIFNLDAFEISGQETFDFQMEHNSDIISCERVPVQFGYNSKPEIMIQDVLWDFGDGESSQTLNPIHAYAFGGDYTVRISFSTDIGCTYEYSQMITVSGPLDPDIELPEDDYCSNEGIIDLPNSNNGKFSGEAISNGNFDPALVTGDSTLISYHFIDANGCNDTLWFYLYNQDVTVQPVEDITLINQIETQVDIQANGGMLSYNWTPTNGLSCSNCEDPVITVDQLMTYSVLVNNEFGCRDSISFSVQSIQEGVFIPNAFSPNNDGRNDSFYPRGISIEEILRMNIYNRYGALIFTTSNIPANDADAGWNGTFNNQLLNGGVFVYEISMQLVSGEMIKKVGTVALIR